MYSEDYPLANQEFLQAQRLIQTYLALAVDKVYTVRLVPGHRDSLWRISEYDAIYASPWDWPKIWKRNQKLIQNPDLIFPGWQLIIPPQ
jgi:nucleoid-associated protein YgaU